MTVGCASCALTPGGLDVRVSLAGNPPPLPHEARQRPLLGLSAALGPLVGVGLRQFPEERLTLLRR